MRRDVNKRGSCTTGSGARGGTAQLESIEPDLVCSVEVVWMGVDGERETVHDE